MPTGLTTRLLGLCLSLAIPFAFAQDALPRINLYTENYGDFNYTLDGRDFAHFRDDIGGESTEVVKQMFERAGIDYRLRLRAWSVSYERALERPNYGVYSTARTEFREDLFEWIGPVGQYSWILLKRAGNPLDINSLNDLRNLRIGGYEGDAATTFLQNEGLNVSTLPNESLNAQRLAQDQIDVWVTSDVNGYKIAEESGFNNVEEAYRLRTVGLYLAMNPATNPTVLSRLRAAYDELIASGEVELR
ncbi:MAG: substrate-binding periplasmic protein [Saccharospirillum sp.]